jgi:hypothetical protein
MELRATDDQIRAGRAQGVHDRGARGLLRRTLPDPAALLEALSPHTEGAPILLIDELDAPTSRSRPICWSLSDFGDDLTRHDQGGAAPIVIITSNRTLRSTTP